MPDKVLLVGPVHGRIAELVAKTSAIQAKHGPFAALFIVGDLFASSSSARPDAALAQQQDDLLKGNITLPVPTYFYQPLSSLPAAVAEHVREARATSAGAASGLVPVTEHLFWAAGKSGVFSTPQGLRVAFVAGTWDAAAFAQDGGLGADDLDPEDWHESPAQRSEDEQTPHITPATVRRLLAHPAFRLPRTSDAAPVEMGASAPKQGTLAAARASASQEQARAARQSSGVELLKQRPPLDLLLTNTWPAGVTLFATPPGGDPTAGLPDPTARTWGSPVIARLASHACARYHFALAPSAGDADVPVGVSDETLAMGAFWERAPYTSDLGAYLAQPVVGRAAWRSVTRFVSLATFANAAKRRWFLALNLTPADAQTGGVVVPPNATPTPYATPRAAASETHKRPHPAAGEEEPNFRFGEAARKRARADGDVPPPGYVCRICGVEGHFIRACPSKATADARTSEAAGGEGKRMPLPVGLPVKPTFAVQGGRQMIPVGPANCWFCLSNPSVEKQLIVTIGSASYLVRPKGPFVHESVNDLPHAGAHLIVVPLAHLADLLPSTHPVHRGVGDDADKAEVRSEVEATKQAVRNVWAQTRHVMLEWTLVRVRTSARMTHFQTQLVALKSDIVEHKHLVQSIDNALDAQAASAHTRVLRANDVQHYFHSQHSPDQTEQRGQRGEEDGYLHIALHLSPDHAGRKQWLVPLYVSTRFPVQFVRAHLAATLDLPQLADWKACTAPSDPEQEKIDSAALRSLLT